MIIDASDIASTTIQWIRTYVQDDVFIEDLNWSSEHFLNSMDKTLRDSVIATLDADFTPAQQGGPRLSHYAR